MTDIVIDLPRPISVNKLRRINWAAHKRAQDWREVANGYLMLAKTRKENPVRFDRIETFELTIVLDEKRVFIDLDNTLKLLIDYLRHVNIVKDDSPKHMRKLTVEWGEASLGARITIKRLDRIDSDTDSVA